MIKATTKHGTYYLIDFENNLAMRVKAEDRNPMSGDSQWFRFDSVAAFDWDTQKRLDRGIEEGKGMYFVVVGHPNYDWRISTTVRSIEDYDETEYLS